LERRWRTPSVLLNDQAAVPTALLTSAGCAPAGYGPRSEFGGVAAWLGRDL